MTNTWPFVVHDTLHKKINTTDSLVILYFPLTGGEFLAKILSCCDEFFGPSYFDFLENYYAFSNNDWLSTYEDGHHENIFPAHARYHTFEQWMNYDNLIYIDYTLTDVETNWLLLRRNFIKNSVYESLHSDLQLKYEKELINFFNLNNKRYFNFPLTSFLNANDFVYKINEYLLTNKISLLNENKVKKIWKQWMNLNIQKVKKK